MSSFCDRDYTLGTVSSLSTSNEFVDRVHGCILAGVLGDAMGGPFEGRQSPFEWSAPKKWLISDDSQLTLATCESIATTGSITPESIAENFLIWFRGGRVTGLGGSTLKALRDLDAGAHWALAGAKGEMSGGNGAAMRIAPLAFMLNPSIPDQRRLIRDVCRITHHSEEAYVGALALLTAIRAVAIERISLDRLLQYVTQYLPDSRVRDRIEELGRLPGQTTLTEVARQFGSSGYVVESVPLALYAVQAQPQASLDRILREVVEAGGDTDTVASMTGQIFGASRGASALALESIDLIPEATEIKRITQHFGYTVEAQFHKS